METLLVRLKPYDPRRGHVLRRFTCRGIRFHEERGWYQVEQSTGDYLRTVHQVPGDAHSPLAFDVCTVEDAMAVDEKEEREATPRNAAAGDIKLSVGREDAALTPTDLPESQPEDPTKPAKRRTRKA